MPDLSTRRVMPQRGLEPRRPAGFRPRLRSSRFPGSPGFRPRLGSLRFPGSAGFRPRLRSPRFPSLLLACALAALVGSVRLAPAADAPATNETTVAGPKDVSELRALEGRVQAVVEKVLPATVGVQIGPARGSGVIVSRDGYVMTAGHVVGKPGQNVTFVLADGKTVKGKTLGLFKNADAGLMKIEDKGEWPYVEKGHSTDLKPGQWCVAVGHPLGYQKGRPPVVRVGRVLRARDTAIQTDCPLVGGDSGGPLFDLEGRVIGINSRIGGAMNMNFHVSVDVYHDVWDRLAKGDAWEEKFPGKDDAKVKAAFRDVVRSAADCVVRVTCDGKDAALGTIVGPDGWVLTKASELKGKIACVLRDKRKLEAKLVGVDESFDLAMLKLEAAGLPVIGWADDEPEVGQWVAVPGTGGDPLAIGVVSVPTREIPPHPGMLGIQMEESDDGPRIKSVIPKSPAQKAGLKPNDVITHVNDKPVKTPAELAGAVRQHKPGEEVRLKVKRGDKQLDMKIRLAKIETPGSEKREMQNNLGVGTSKRRDDFPEVLQHDCVVKPADCGGPVVDLDGDVVGVNVARAGRVETYCVPVAVLPERMYELMSGRLNPKLVEQQKAEAKKKAEAGQKQADEARKAAEEAIRQAEEARKKAEEARNAEEARKAEEEKRKAEEARKAEEEKRKAEEARKAEEEKRKAEEEAKKKAEEQAKPAEQDPKPQDTPPAESPEKEQPPQEADEDPSKQPESEPKDPQEKPPTESPPEPQKKAA